MSLPQEARVWLEKARLASVPKIRDSSSYLGLVTEHFLSDPICLLQLGAAVALGKPMFIIVMKGTKLPSRMIDVVDGIVEINSPSELPEAQDKIKAMLEKKGLL